MIFKHKIVNQNSLAVKQVGTKIKKAAKSQRDIIIWTYVPALYGVGKLLW